jgi:hypothetical protein
MWLGLSKSLGGGFRVGVGTRIGSRRKIKGPTQAQIAKYEKTSFLKEIAEEANQLLKEFLVNNSIEPSYVEKRNLDMELLFKESPAKEDYNRFIPSITELKNIIGRVDCGGNLTASRRDKIVDLIFSMREIVAGSGPGLNLVADNISIKYKKISLITFSTIFLILWLMASIGSLVGSGGAEQNQGVWSLVIGSLIVTAILYIPIHFIIKFIAKINYRNNAILVMKTMYRI